MCFLFKSQILSCEIWRRKSICRWKLVLRCYSCGTSVSTLACWHVVNVGPFLKLHTNSHAIQSTSPYHLSRLPSHHQSLSHLIHFSSNFSSHIILSPWYMLLSQKLCCFPPAKILQLLEFISKFPKNVSDPNGGGWAGSSQRGTVAMGISMTSWYVVDAPAWAKALYDACWLRCGSWESEDGISLRVLYIDIDDIV